MNVSNTFWTERATRLRVLLEFFFSATIASTASYALTLYAVGRGSWSANTDTEYYFFRGVLRVADLLRLGATNAVSTDAVARRGQPIQWSFFAIDVTLLASLCSLTVCVLLVVRILNRSSFYRVAFGHLAGITAIFAPAILSLLISGLVFESDIVGTSAWSLKRFTVRIFFGELVGFVFLTLAARRRRISAWTSASLLILHYGFWCWVLLATIPVLGGPGIFALSVYVFHLSIWLFPSAGAAWLLYVTPGSRFASGIETGTGAARWTFVAASLGLVTLCAIWFPPRGYLLAPPKDLRTAVIEMSRGPCYGSCPSYTITIHGDGTVEYVGGRLARQDRQTSNIGTEAFTEILQQLDRSHFSTLEGRAFLWCFDTSSVAITVSVDGRSRRVTSDAGCTGAKRGVQARFVQVADAIDKAVGSARWVQCDGGYCRN